MVTPLLVLPQKLPFVIDPRDTLRPIGIAPTKTLAKLANRLAKKGLSPDGPVLDWTRLSSPAAALAGFPVEDIWGIADRSGARLRHMGIADALALRDADTRRMRPAYSRLGLSDPLHQARP